MKENLVHPGGGRLPQKLWWRRCPLPNHLQEVVGQPISIAVVESTRSARSYRLLLIIRNGTNCILEFGWGIDETKREEYGRLLAQKQCQQELPIIVSNPVEKLQRGTPKCEPWSGLGFLVHRGRQSFTPRNLSYSR